MILLPSATSIGAWWMTASESYSDLERSSLQNLALCEGPATALPSVAIALVDRGDRIDVRCHTVDRGAAAGESSRSAVYEVVWKIQGRCSERIQTFLVLLCQLHVECRQVILELL